MGERHLGIPQIALSCSHPLADWVEKLCGSQVRYGTVTPTPSTEHRAQHKPDTVGVCSCTQYYIVQYDSSACRRLPAMNKMKVHGLDYK